MKRYLFFVAVLILFTSKVSGNNKNKRIKVSNIESDFLLKKLQEKSPTSSFDTIVLIEKYIKQADVNKNKGLYTLAYGDLWKALSLADSYGEMEQLITIHSELGGLYGIYGKHKKAIEHKLLALQHVKKQFKDSNKDKILLRKAYYNLAVQHRRFGDYEKSLQYLDSCVYIFKEKFKSKENPYVLAERGKVFLLQQKTEAAEPLLLRAEHLLKKEDRHYLVIIYSFLGDLYTQKSEFNKAREYYKKSLNKLENFNAHTDIKSDVLKKIALTYQYHQKLDTAYYYLHKSTKIADSLFSMRNQNNSQLFEIKNEYEENLLKKDQQIFYQNHLIEKKKRIQAQLIFVIVFILFLVIGFVILVYYRTKVRKLEVEQEKNEIKIKHDQEKLNVVLETKSKELTVSALQLIEKDKNIDKLLSLLKDSSPESYRTIKKEVVRGNKDLWESFNLRFTEVNIGFYKRLKEKHSNLSPTEQKHCALIKLKFDSKEMARLLNISVNSVHISRHRIRKKMELQRDDDLSNYIASI
ncbi:tetratricopeptide repeat protein [Wenyingzhuangia aestuarii]|uniref:tetratricopeptide repeat protein n=1 Tax=Wenyingzhuangia aestuarii TaxID=1647582 RepID=UPI00143BFCA8|nr:tetratricopeptide repeat protein [Wenyingzhuangia aestuarii]NJB81586.1 tetratricopeptide (TPR) repeat protein/DNA-binding CsgD family transcriptional regulator [Wenyingzhuangia aestuarii]